AFTRRRPRAHRRAVRRVDEAETLHRTRRRPGEDGERRDHRIQQRQGDRDAHATQEGPTGQRHLEDTHRSAPHRAATFVFAGRSASAPRALRIWNGVLFTTPRISAWSL